MSQVHQEAASETRSWVSISAVLDNPNLPSPPALALQIVQKASQPACKIEHIVELLSCDAGLCSKVLKTVNSGLFGLSQPVTSLKRAVTVLGLRPLRSLVLSLALPAMQIRERDDTVLRYWQESVAGAVIARELSTLLRRPEREDDLVCGLLRDIGVLVLREAFPEEYEGVRTRASRDWSRCQSEDERATFGVDHAEVSAALLHSWDLPADLFMPVRYHHDPAAFADATKPQLERTQLLHFASKVAALAESSQSAAWEVFQLGKKYFGLDQKTLIKFLDSVTPTIGEFADILKVDIAQCPNYANILAAGTEQLVRLAVDSDRNGPQVAAPPSPRLDLTHDLSRVKQPLADGLSTGSTEALPNFDMSCMRTLPPGGARLQGYVVQEILGQGGMGVVFKAYDPELQRHAAIKMLTPERLVLSEARERFKREARAAAAIHHPNVTIIYAVSELYGVPFLVMEYLAGRSLQHRLEESGPLPIKTVIEYGRQIAAGLQAAHQRRVIHRDIKPANILIDEDTGLLKLTDFGLARVMDESRLSQDGLWVGTPLYMAPEQFGSMGEIDHRVDLFSLGSVLFELCAGRTPFLGTNVLTIMRQVCSDAPPPLRLFRSDVPSWLEAAITKLLCKTPAGRFASAAQVVEHFEKHA